MKIIGGPALRLTTPASFHVWLVLDERAASIEAFAVTAQSHDSGNAIGRSTQVSQTPTQLGDRLFLYLLEVRSKGRAYPLDTKIFYNVMIDGTSIRAASLFHGGTQAQGLTYGSDKLPSLVIPTKHARILQMSCRKPHGGSAGRPAGDMASKADDLVRQGLDRPATRPTMLLMSGDQIYADDVAAPFPCALIEAARTYTGWDESMPPPRRGNGANVTPAQIPLSKRDGALRKRSGFSAPKKEHHLMTFGEYMTMYLAVWGGLPVVLPRYEAVLDRIPTRLQQVRGGRKVRRPVITHDQYESDRSRVAEFLKNAWKLRRVMANVPTYMIFDDHEISDDWNLTRENQDALRAAGTLGRRLQSNALAAYWACQGFGNNPSQFDAPFKSAVSGFLTAKSVAGGAAYENALLAQYWGYRIDGYPITFVLDTRTRREFPANQKLSTLMDRERLRDLRRQIIDANSTYAADRDGQSLLLVSPAPLLGFKAIERLQLGASFAPRRLDGEPWIGSKTAFETLKDAVAQSIFKECSVVSGDVHYAYVRKLDLTNSANEPLSVFQFTSSATNNAPAGVRRLFLRQLEKRDLREFNREQSPYLFPVGLEDEHFINGDNNLGVIELGDGRPVKNVYYFGDAATGQGYKWEYRLGNPVPVHFP